MADTTVFAASESLEGLSCSNQLIIIIIVIILFQQSNLLHIHKHHIKFSIPGIILQTN